MNIKIVLLFLLISSSIFSQEIGRVKNGSHSIKLFKSDSLFSCTYSDVNSKTFKKETSFNFPNKETVYRILMNGFKHKSDHQVIVQTSNDTIVKFEFKNVRGKKMLKIKQNNLLSKTFGTSIFFTKDEIIQLFGSPQIATVSLP